MRRAFVDASVFITLAEIGQVELLGGVDGEVVVLPEIAEEITEDPAASWLTAAEEMGWIRRGTTTPGGSRPPELDQARIHLGHDETDPITGDIALLAAALMDERPVVVVTDDKPLRDTCKALGIPISGSIGVVIASVERGDIHPEKAKDALVAMDEVGARLSARVLRKGERLIDEASEKRED